MKNSLPEKLYDLARACPVPLYVVGGTCRDYLAGLNPPERDLDICAPLGAEEFARVAEENGFTVSAVYKNTGTVKLSYGRDGFEFASFRSDKYVRGEHNPVQTYFTGDIEKDARRRDFKCNAVYYDLKEDKFVDVLGGIEDIKNKTLSTVTDADKVFGEDGLRLMRLCRFAARLGFTPTNDCLAAAHKNRALIADVSPERIFTELNYILNADLCYGVDGAQYRGVEYLKRTGVLAFIFPELTAGDGMAQRADFHAHDVLEHSLRCVKYAPPEIRLAALLHDIGKPISFKTTGKFALHERVGAEIAENRLTALRAPKKLIKETVELIKYHMYDFNCLAKPNKIKKFIVENLEIIPKLLLLKQADFSACKDDLSKAPCVEKWEKIISQMKKAGAPLSLKQLEINGKDLLDAGISPPEVGKTLNFLLGECAINPALNKKSKLLNLALGKRGLRK